MFTMYTDFVINLAVDLVAMFVLAYVLYFRRHRRADLLLGYVALNMGIFVAVSLLSTAKVDIAVGFGLFAILSIIRLRSSAVTQQEVAYYFVTLVLGLVNGLNLSDHVLVATINVLMMVTMALVDSRSLRERARRIEVTLDVVHADSTALVADLERRLGGVVLHHEVNEIDYPHHTMAVDVRYRPGPDPVRADVEERRLEVKLDVVYPTDAALVADLERRLGGRVLDFRVKDIDYLRNNTIVNVRYQVESGETYGLHAQPEHR